MKRYLVFAHYRHYPDGGWNDFHGSFTGLSDAKIRASILIDEYDYAHVVDTETMNIVLNTEK